MAIADVIAQLQAKVQAKDQALVQQIVQSATENLCLSYGLDLTATRSGLFDNQGHQLTMQQALAQLGNVVTPARLQAAVLDALQTAVSGV